MKRHWWKVVLLVLIGLCLFFWFTKTPFIASYLSEKMGVSVSIKDISIRPSQSIITDFSIKNISGFKTKTAFKSEMTQIQYRLRQLFGSPTEIDRIELDNVFLSIEFSNPLGTANNWTAIAARMPKQEKRSDVIIHKLILNNLVVEIRGLGFEPPTTKTFGRMEFDEIDSREGFPTKELIRKIFGQAGLLQYIQDVFNPQKVLEKYLSPLRLFGTENEELSQPRLDSR